MIQRFCFIKLVDDAVPDRGKIAELARAELQAACADVVVGLPADDSAIRWDLSIVFTAATLEAWHAIARLPDVIRALDDLASRASVVKAWTFEGS